MTLLTIATAAIVVAFILLVVAAYIGVGRKRGR
jgi:hypothetical protein